MPEPDFDQIAGMIVDRYTQIGGWSLRAIAEQLRQVWNARGAADLETIEATIACHRLDWIEQVRKLDR
jgi:hypothetical protein